VLPIQVPVFQRICKLVLMSLLFVLFMISIEFPAWSNQQEKPDMKDMPGMNHADMQMPTAPEDPAVVAKRLADKRESEFNHHLAGVFVVLAGLFILGEDKLAKRWPLLRYAWPVCFLAAGIFLLIFSDTEIWPFGPQTPWYAITHNVEDLQHKTFAVILLALGYVEFERARGRFKAAWTAWFFPIVGMAGAVLLLFHVHGGDMNAPGAMETMEHIQKEHFWFASTGFGIALTNGLAETPSKWKQIFKYIWPTLLIVLGVLLIRYTE
jgi:putative copper resistance protein D